MVLVGWSRESERGEKSVTQANSNRNQFASASRSRTALLFVSSQVRCNRSEPERNLFDVVIGGGLRVPDGKRPAFGSCHVEPAGAPTIAVRTNNASAGAPRFNQRAAVGGVDRVHANLAMAHGVVRPGCFRKHR